MWHCARCREAIEDGFDMCWSCGLPREEVAIEAVGEADAAPPTRWCAACEVPLVERGTAPLRVGGPDGPGDGWSFFRAADQIEQRLWKVEVWACPTCRQLKLFEPEPE